jgi:serine/threonine-protein kinase
MPGELEPGAEVAGFRVERVLGRGSRSVVYEATQHGLDRRAALKLMSGDARLAARFQKLEWPEHRNVVRLYAAGAWEHGQFLAMQLVTGPTLGDLLATGALDAERLEELLAEVAAALDAAHASGIVHGSVSARNVLVGSDGRALLTDFGLGDADASAESDRAELQELARSAAAVLPPPPRPARRANILAGIAAAALVATAAALFGGSDPKPGHGLQVLAGARVLGSALAPAGIESRDCNGRPPSGASPQCTLVQTRLTGRVLVAPGDGVIRRWTVRGGRGRLALQVLRPHGRSFDAVTRTDYADISGDGLHRLPANLPIRTGDLVGLQVTPGAAIGVRRGVKGATVARSFAPPTFTARPIDGGAGSGLRYEVLLRVEYVPGARPDVGGLLSGRAAARAAAGVQLASRDVEPRSGQVRTLALVRVEGRIAVDLFDSGRRLQRLTVAGADAGGRALGFDTLGEPIVRLHWRNPGGGIVDRDYAVGSRSVAPSS